MIKYLTTRLNPSGSKPVVMCLVVSANTKTTLVWYQTYASIRVIDVQMRLIFWINKMSTLDTHSPTYTYLKFSVYSLPLHTITGSITLCSSLKIQCTQSELHHFWKLYFINFPLNLGTRIVRRHTWSGNSLIMLCLQVLDNLSGAHYSDKCRTLNVISLQWETLQMFLEMPIWFYSTS